MTGGDSLPKDCQCFNEFRGGRIECDVLMLGNDPIGVEVRLLPCHLPSMVDVRIKEEAHDIRFQLAAIRAGKEVRVPVPGLSVGVPSGPNAGVQLRVFLNGSPSSLQTLVCLGACAQVGFFWL